MGVWHEVKHTEEMVEQQKVVISALNRILYRTAKSISRKKLTIEQEKAAQRCSYAYSDGKVIVVDVKDFIL